MTGYVIVRADGAFVSRPGSRRSYTDKLQDAQVFPTKESAQANCCPENEQAKSIEEIMGYA